MQDGPIVVGVDGSEGSRVAVSWVARLAAQLDAEVLAVCGYSANPMLGEATNEEVVDGLRHDMETTWVEPLREAGVRFRGIVEEGDPRILLLAVARMNEADLIVVGSRGRGPLSEMLLGSVAQYLTHHAGVPVVVVPTRSG